MPLVILGQGKVVQVPERPTRAEIERIERDNFPELFEVPEGQIMAKPPVLQKLWDSCIDY